jgi:hypothetical protein
MTNIKLAAVLFAALVFSMPASAGIILTATLTGLGENPPNASPAIGFGTVTLNDAQTLITVDESWSGLTAPATASHIHTGAPGTNGPVTFPFSGVPAATSGSIPEQTFAINAAQVAALLSGGMYMNVHTANFPGGEIRGQLTVASVPEPMTVVFIGIGLGGLAVMRQRRSV